MNERVRRPAAIIVLALVAGIAAAGTPPGADPRVALVTEYLDALRRGDDAGARGAWRPGDLVRAERLDIRYTDLPLKLDGDSYPGRTAAAGSLEIVVGDVGVHPLESLLAEPPVMALVPVTAGVAGAGSAAEHPYLGVETTEGWRLASPVAVVLEDCARCPGAVSEGRFVRAVTGPGMEGCRPALAALDSFVDLTLSRLDVPVARRRLLEQEKIDYLFVPPDWVDLLAGAPTVGVANLQVDAVVTHHPCHLHELAHILMNHRLAELPLFTLPVLQEGLAVHLGGRWGRGPDALAPVGRLFLRDGFIALSDLLPWEGFHRQGADLSYAAAGVLAGWLLDDAGADAFVDAYRALSGPPTVLAALTADDVAAVMGAPLGLPGTDVAALDQALRARLTDSPGNPLRAAPGRPVEEPLRRFAAGGLELCVWRQADGWIVEATAPPGDVPAGALLVGVAAAPSALFREHFPDAAGDAAAAALRFSPEEAGWYDYARDQLVVKHIAAFWPDPPAYDPATRTLRLAWPAALAPWDPTAESVSLQPDAPR